MLFLCDNDLVCHLWRGRFFAPAATSTPGGGRPETVTSRWRERKYTVSEYIYIYIYTHLQLWWFVVGLVVGGFPGTQATGFVVDQLSLIGSDPI
jgi:hypothetical protein